MIAGLEKEVCWMEISAWEILILIVNEIIGYIFVYGKYQPIHFLYVSTMFPLRNLSSEIDLISSILIDYVKKCDLSKDF